MTELRYPEKGKKRIHIPAQYDDENYRRWVCERWMTEYMSALVAHCGRSPFYGHGGGWRVDLTILR
jgi:hypothetical protein